MHDTNGTPLNVGDKVLIPAVVKTLSPGDDYCNVCIETTLGRRPDGRKEQIAAINTGVLVKVSGGEVNLGLSYFGGDSRLDT